MRTTTWVRVVGLAFLLSGCNGDENAPPAAGGGDGGGGGTASADGFTHSVIQAAGSPNENQEPSTDLTQTAATAPEDAEPARI